MGYTNSSLVNCTVKSPNHSGTRTHKIDRITPHCIVGQLSAETIGHCFTNSSVQASCNYGIGLDGRVCLVVDEANRSWCSSSKVNDQRAITIEVASDSTAPYAFKDVAYQKLVKLCIDICKRNGLNKVLWFNDKNTALNYNPKDGECVLTVHRWFANKSCPGDWMFSRMGQLASEINAGLGSSSASTSTSSSSSTPITITSFPTTPFTVNVIVPDLNYRSLGSMNGKILGQTGKGTFIITQVNNDGWGKLKSGAGWIYLGNPSYCTIQKTVQNSTSTATNTSKFPSTPFTVEVLIPDLNYRSLGSMNGKILGQTGKGTFTIVETNKDGWGKLKSGAGWIYLENASYCTIIGVSNNSSTTQPSAPISNPISAPTTTNVMICHSSIDENGKASGGIAGDQTGKEVYTRTWYNKPWSTLIRYKDSSIAEKAAAAAVKLANSNLVGYDQSGRNTLYQALKRHGWDVNAYIASGEKTESDCSSFVYACYAIYIPNIRSDSNAPVTSNMASKYKNWGFSVFTDSKYLTGSSYLRVGDLLVGSGHTVMSISNGINSQSTIQAPTGAQAPASTATGSKKATDSAQSKNSALAGTYKTTAALNIRNGAGTSKAIMTTIPNQFLVKNYGYYSTDASGVKWLYIQFTYKEIVYTGFASSEYLQKQ